MERGSQETRVRAKEMKRTFSLFFGVNKLFYYYDNI